MKQIAFGILILLSSCQSPTHDLPQEIWAESKALPEKIDYNTHIKPILSDRCFKCHGPDKNKVEAGLQLTTAALAGQKLASGRRAIIGGNLQKSELIRRILSHDPDLQMPTPKSNLTLTHAEKALLIKWVEQGARYQEHWAFLPIKKPKLPKIGTFLSKIGLQKHWENDWVKNDIDHFVVEKFREKGLKPKPEADKATLLRRLSFDLTGLPPSTHQLDKFLADKSENAYEKQVDFYLAQKQMGEHFAASWLDAARYADTQGYQDDGMRNAFPYRDWVINAFNQNLPFDQFVTHQLAGDLLPNPTENMLIATAFNRQHQQSQEGGIVAEEYQTEYIADRVNTFGKVFLGLTTECARCHDHKYDPISAKDYYGLYAFFNSNNEFGEIPYNGEPSPHITLVDAQTKPKLQQIKNYLKKLEFEPDHESDFQSFKAKFQLEAIKKSIIHQKLIDFSFERIISPKKDEYEIENRAFAKRPFGIYGEKPEHPVLIKGKIGNGLYFKSGGYVELKNGVNFYSDFDKAKDFEASAFFDRYQPFNISFWLLIDSPKTVGSILNRNAQVFNGFRGWDFTREKDGKLRFRLSHVWPDNAIDIVTQTPIPLKKWVHISLSYMGLSDAATTFLYINGHKVPVDVFANNLTQSTIHGKNKSWWGAGTMGLAVGRWHDQVTKGYAIDELHIYNDFLSQLELNMLYFKKSSFEPEILKEHYYQKVDDVAQRILKAKRKLLQYETQLLLKQPVDVAIMKSPLIKRKSYFLRRGAYDAPDHEVAETTPAKFNKFSYAQNRLGLAQWLLAKENPLFGRVMVNRFWMNFFGNGIVKTQEDFGNQGDAPTHAQLLDYLAVSFREHNWNTQWLLKTIVMSATYRQSSTCTAAEKEADPDNKWLARGSVLKLTAEQVRDHALLAAGLLNKTIGGPSVYPYQPEGIWEALATRNAVQYKQNHGDSLYRRSLYTIWKRSSPPPMMLNFDAAERHSCTVRRQKTATPLQALVTMNDPQFIEAARVLAERLFDPLVPTNAIKLAAKNILSRKLTEEELHVLGQLYKQQLDIFGKNPAAAKALLNIGEKKPNKVNAEIAPLTVVNNTLFNMDECLIRR